MLSHLILALGPATVAAATSAYAPATLASCPTETLVRSADGISSSEATYIASRKAAADTALSSWLSTALPSYIGNSSSLPTIALSVSGGGFRSLLTGAGVIQALDGRDSDASTAGLYQSLTYHAGLSGGAWLLSALAAGNWPTISELVSSTWATQFAGGILDSSNAATLAAFVQIATDLTYKGAQGFPVSLTDPWGRMLSYQFMNGGTGAAGFAMSDIPAQSNFTDFNAPFPLITATKISQASGECNPSQTEALYEFNPFEFGSWSDDISAFVQSEYLGSNLSSGALADGDCVTGFDSLDWVLGVSSNLLQEYVCNTTLGVDITEYFPSSILAIVEQYTSTDLYGYSMVPNPFKAFTSTTATTTSSVADLDTLYLVDGGLPSHNVAILPLLEPSRNVSVLIINDNSNDVAAYPDGAAVVAAAEATQSGRLAGRFPTVPAIGEFSTSQAQFFGCDEPDAVTVVYLPNAEWTYASNTSTLQLAYTAAETAGMIENGNNVASQGGDAEWAGCLACGILLKEVGESALPAECAACLEEYCWSA